MIYVLFSNGASVVPQFIPIVFQLWLLFFAVKTLMRGEVKIALPVVNVIFGLFILTFWALIFGELSESGRILKLFFNSIIAVLIANEIDNRYPDKFSIAYSKAILIITIMGILGLVLESFFSWHITTEIGERQYHTNLLTTWLSDGDYNSSKSLFSPFQFRLQAMFDEPGTFGILLIPAFYFFVQRSDAISSLIILIGAYLTESVNAWLICGFILIVKISTMQSVLIKLGALIIFLVGVNFLWPILTQLYEIKFGLDHAYKDVNSFGVRSSEYNYIYENFIDHIIPFQNGEMLKNIFPNGVSVAYVSWLITGGWVFLLGISAVLISFFIKLKKYWGGNNLELHFSMVLAGTLLFSGLQRSSFFDNILFMSLMFWFLIKKPNIVWSDVWLC